MARTAGGPLAMPPGRPPGPGAPADEPGTARQRRIRQRRGTSGAYAPGPPAHRRNRFPIAVSAIGLVLLIWLLFTILGSEPPGAARVGSPGSSGPPGGTANLRIQHVVVIVLENREVHEVWGLAPYESYLQSRFGNATHFFSLCHGSPPNYIAMTSGRSEYCGSNVSGLVNGSNIGDLLENAGLSWAGYFESMPTPCSTYSNGTYVAWHDPFIAYDDILDNPARCAAHVLPSEQFNASVAAGTLPTFSLYVPNSLDDCDYATLAHCDGWLQSFLTPILNATSAPEQALVGHTAFFIVYDEGSTDAGYASPVITSDCVQSTGKALTTCGGQVYLAVVSPYSIGTSYTNDATSFNVESTVEWLFGLPSDGGYDGSADFPPMTSLFDFASNNA